MEDMARLALVEQFVRDVEKFSKILYELLRNINRILENPHDYELRTIKSETLRQIFHQQAFADYLKSIGFEWVGSDYTYPKDQTLSKLRIAQAAIERKIYFCCGSLSHNEAKIKSGINLPVAKKPKLKPVKVLKTSNPLLLKIESLFNDMLRYESEELQELARDHIPIMNLQLMALDRVREQQRKLKTGELKGHDLPFDIALLMELLGWFKYSFFSWVDRPACESCAGPTVHVRNQTLMREDEYCRVELYRCKTCDGKAEFPRFNDVRTLLRTRRGRCGEWANCFCLFCRSLGYDTRYVYDTTDHVWCEVFDFDSNTWLHADPCEGKLNAPLMYSHGWNKKLSYVIALSRDDLQDVTWRYTTEHKEVLKRRTECSEQDLMLTILTLREHRQRQVSDARRKYLARRCLQELVQLMTERQPSDYESHGRISGSKEWRSERGEIGARASHVFHLQQPGLYTIRYYTAADVYRISCDNGSCNEIKGWSRGVFHTNNMFLKLEDDWRMAYLAREDSDSSGTISWKLSVKEELRMTRVSVRLISAQYETGRVDWTVKFDDLPPVPTKLGESLTEWVSACHQVTFTAMLSGGVGDCAWQHAQLFRQSLEATESALDVHVTVEGTQ